MMRQLAAGIAMFFVATCLGCSEVQEPVPEPIAAVPVSKDVQLPPGMPDDQWFYDEVVASPIPVLVDFGATWCPPCRKLKPILHELEGEANGRFKIVLVDIDQRSYLADNFQVSGIPHLMIIHKGKIQRTSVGLMPRKELMEFVLAPTE